MAGPGELVLQVNGEKARWHSGRAVDAGVPARAWAFRWKFRPPYGRPALGWDRLAFPALVLREAIRWTQPGAPLAAGLNCFPEGEIV